MTEKKTHHETKQPAKEPTSISSKSKTVPTHLPMGEECQHCNGKVVPEEELATAEVCKYCHGTGRISA